MEIRKRPLGTEKHLANPTHTNMSHHTSGTGTSSYLAEPCTCSKSSKERFPQCGADAAHIPQVLRKDSTENTITRCARRAPIVQSGWLACVYIMSMFMTRCNNNQVL